MKNLPTPDEVRDLFANTDPNEVWGKASDIIRHVNPAYDFSFAKTTFDDVVRLFRGEYPGYGPIRTLYHNLPHTLDVFLCAVRLMHGVHLSGIPLTDNEMTIIMIAALMHDIGYAQQRGEEYGTGAQFTRSHVKRSIEFMQHYTADQHFPPDMATLLEPIIQGTDHLQPFAKISFPNERTRLLGQIVSTAD